MKFEISNRWTGEVQFTAEIDASEHTATSVKVGLAVKWSVKNDANLRGADLRGANLSGADLRDANLLCMGNMREIRTMQIDKWAIGYTADTLQIGCQSHAMEKWRKWDTEAGRKWIAQMDAAALAWADRNLALVLQIVDANPATGAA